MGYIVNGYRDSVNEYKRKWGGSPFLIDARRSGRVATRISAEREREREGE